MVIFHSYVAVYQRVAFIGIIGNDQRLEVRHAKVFLQTWGYEQESW